MAITTLQLKSSNRNTVLFGAMAMMATFAAWATNYWFHISSAGAAYATAAYGTDREAEFEGANKIPMMYTNYITASAKIKAIANDYMYISYHDGKIAKFKVVATSGTIRLRFDELVPSVPPDAKTGTFTIGTNAFDRMDYINGAAGYFYEKTTLPTGSVTVIQYPDGSGTGCDRNGCSNPIMEGVEQSGS
jgi:hypothetical protein